MVRGSGWLEARADLHMKKIYLNLNKISQAVSPNMKEIFKHKNPPREEMRHVSVLTSDTDHPIYTLINCTQIMLLFEKISEQNEI